tara:strand:- start:227 stop:490 length:264 start_codon:yes stop_codon:yes gene_type:complete
MVKCVRVYRLTVPILGFFDKKQIPGWVFASGALGTGLYPIDSPSYPEDIKWKMMEDEDKFWQGKSYLTSSEVVSILTSQGIRFTLEM